MDMLAKIMHLIILESLPYYVAILCSWSDSNRQSVGRQATLNEDLFNNSNVHNWHQWLATRPHHMCTRFMFELDNEIGLPRPRAHRHWHTHSFVQQTHLVCFTFLHLFAYGNRTLAFAGLSDSDISNHTGFDYVMCVFDVKIN